MQVTDWTKAYVGDSVGQNFGARIVRDISMICGRAFLFALCVVAFVPPARAQDRLLFESFVERCNNVDGEFTADQSIHGCTQIIRSDYVIGRALAATYNTRAMRHLQKRDDARALADFNQAIRYSPHYAQAYLNRAALHLVHRDYARAIADYDAVVAILPDQSIPYSARCWARALWGQELEVGRTDCDTALRLGPGDPQVLDSRGMINLREGRFEEAFNDYAAAVQGDPSRARHLYGRGIAALRLGRNEEGEADLAAAARIEGDIAQTYADYGVTP